MRSVRQAIIMVGGKGTRLLPLTKDKPKPILPVDDRPCLWYLMRSFASAGIEEIILACGYRSQQLMDAIGDGSDLGVTIRYSFEDEPRGTAGAMKIAEDMLDDVFVAANGDVFADIDVTGQIDAHFNSGAAITISLIPVPNPCEFGTALVEDDGRISRFIDKPRPEEVLSNLINAGVYVVDKKVLSYVPDDEFYDFSMHVFPQVLQDGLRIQGFPLKGIWMDVGRPRDLLRANLSIAERYGMGGGTVSRSELKGTCYVGRGAVVEDSTVCQTVVSEDATIKWSMMDNVLIMARSIVEDACVRDSIIGESCIIGEGSDIRNAVLGDGTVIPPGTVLDEGREVG